MTKQITPTRLILYTSVFWVLFCNIAFFQHVLQVFPLSLKNSGFLASLPIVLIACIGFLLTLVSWKYTIKPILIACLILSSFAAYFMDNYNVIIDHIMIQNTVETNTAEAFDLFNIQLLLYSLVLGILPSIIVYKLEITSSSFKTTAFVKIRDIAVYFLIILSLILLFSQFYTSFFREHKTLRFYTNPTYYLYSTVKYTRLNFNKDPVTVKSIGTDAKVVETDNDTHNGTDLKELVILVVGEAARADHFSLNGYERETNPLLKQALLKQEKIVNFPNMYSCGTSTAISVPCMFSIFGKNNFDSNQAKATENVLDVLNHTGQIEILWRDNNSDSKGVAARVPYENFRDPQYNPVCSDGECRDEGMLASLDDYIKQRPGKDILIVLHQMGNHGPAYYKRYPKTFEVFKPVCQKNQLEACEKQEIINAYDNAIVYTDYFLTQVIKFLKKYDASHETALIYLSDHGESLGENGIYLHGMPYLIAPDAQTHIPFLMWFGENILHEDINFNKVMQNQDKRYTHDYLFHTLLGLFETKTEVYDPSMDMLHN